jgi:hypothetical protein
MFAGAQTAGNGNPESHTEIANNLSSCEVWIWYKYMFRLVVKRLSCLLAHLLV